MQVLGTIPEGEWDTQTKAMVAATQIGFCSIPKKRKLEKLEDYMGIKLNVQVALIGAKLELTPLNVAKFRWEQYQHI